MRCLLLGICGLWLVVAGPAGAQYHFSRVVTGLAAPVYVTQPPGDARLFVAERAGRIQIASGGGVLATPFLDISNQVFSGGEGGLLGLAFAPDYATSGRFYVNYTRPCEGAQLQCGCATASCDDGGGSCVMETVVSRFLRDTGNPDLADPASEEELISIAQPNFNHNGGHLAFGPDGMLYVGMGDGGDASTAQDVSSPLGAMLRIDVSPASGCAIPGDNPDLGPGSDARIWSYGFRNPFRFSFDRLTGDLFVGDVGEELWEEVDFQPAGSPGGENYGWSVMEASACFDPPVGCSTAGLTLPVMEYEHAGERGWSVTGGYRYRGSLPSLQGVYLFSDFLLPFYAAEFQASSGTFSFEAVSIATDAGSIGLVVSFGEDTAGELYVADFSDGEIFRLLGRDLDGDGLFDDDDNCPEIFNPLQEDANQDGIGDVCELCRDGLDNDGDGLIDFVGGDPGCDSATDLSERSAGLPCDDGVDNDGDGRIDFDPLTFAAFGDESTPPAGGGDPGCFAPSSSREDPHCQDGVDNDGDGRIDYDAGRSANGTVHPGGRDLQCGVPWSVWERPLRGFGCGLGFELAPCLTLLWLWGRRRQRWSAR